MKVIPCAVMIVLLSLTVDASSQDTAKESKLLDGTWLPTAAELGGQAMPDALLKTMKLIVAGGTYTVHIGDMIDKGTVKIDVTKKPKTMDIVGGEGPNKGKTFLAIYELNGDTLRVCYDFTGKNRPSEFKTSKESATFLATYQRKKVEK